MIIIYLILFFFFFNDTATTEIYTLSLHDALPIFKFAARPPNLNAESIEGPSLEIFQVSNTNKGQSIKQFRSEEHTSELQSQSNLVCRLLLEKKKKTRTLLS